MPLTTISMDPIPRERMGNATSLFNLMRNLGGSIGIATTGSLLAAKAAGIHQRDGRPCDAVLSKRRATRSKRRARAFSRPVPTPATATERAYAAVFGTVQRHAAMVAFVDVFRLLGIIFLLLLPLVMLMRRPRGRAAAAAH